MNNQSWFRTWGIVGALTVGLAALPGVALAHGENDTGARGGSSASSHHEKNDDTSITKRVKANLAMTGTEGRDIHVDTHDGNVTLSGTLKSESHRKDMVASAKDTKGVKSVKDDIKLRQHE